MLIINNPKDIAKAINSKVAINGDIPLFVSILIVLIFRYLYVTHCSVLFGNFMFAKIKSFIKIWTTTNK